AVAPRPCGFAWLPESNDEQSRSPLRLAQTHRLAEPDRDRNGRLRLLSAGSRWGIDVRHHLQHRESASEGAGGGGSLPKPRNSLTLHHHAQCNGGPRGQEKAGRTCPGPAQERFIANDGPHEAAHSEFI